MADTTALRPFRLEVPEAALDDLRARLERTRWPDQIAGVGWDHGIPLDYVRELAEYWCRGYDWRRHEAEINASPQVISTIDGTTVHAMHVRSPEAGALPLLLTHGWPGSIVEFLDVVGPLADPRAYGADPSDAFHVVVGSIPGFGLSGPTTDAGWDVRRIARAWRELMDRLGYPRYGAHGGDWGSRISWELGRCAPGQVAGVHVSMLVPDEQAAARLSLTAEEQARLDRFARFRAEQNAYMRIQATRPQTVAYGLTDSPVAQLAWIAEKFEEWTDIRLPREDPVDRDRMLTDVMLYWLTGTAGSAARLYYEFARSSSFGPPGPAGVPTGVAVFGHDTVLPIRRVAQRDPQVVHWSEFDRGGHFAALEQPDLLVGDIRAFFRSRR